MPQKSLNVLRFVAPQIPVLSTDPPAGPGWIHEIKHDGFRTLIGVSGKDARAFTRSGLDWSDRSARSFPGPWRVDVTEGSHFVVRDATGFSVCYMYCLQR
jgi:hypothetical protein